MHPHVIKLIMKIDIKECILLKFLKALKGIYSSGNRLSPVTFLPVSFLHVLTKQIIHLLFDLFRYLFTRSHTYTHPQTHIQTHTHIYTYTNTHTLTHTYTHTHTQTHTHTHTNTYVPHSLTYRYTHIN